MLPLADCRFVLRVISGDCKTNAGPGLRRSVLPCTNRRLSHLCHTTQIDAPRRKSTQLRATECPRSCLGRSLWQRPQAADGGSLVTSPGRD